MIEAKHPLCADHKPRRARRPGPPLEETPAPQDRLGHAIRLARGNDAALGELLTGEVAAWERLAARLVLTRELGAERAQELCRRSFGHDPLPTAPSSPPSTRARTPSPPSLAYLFACELGDLVAAAADAGAPLEAATLTSLLAAVPRPVVSATISRARGRQALVQPLLQAQAALDRPSSPTASGGAPLARLAQRRAATLFRRATSSAEVSADQQALHDLVTRGGGSPLPDALRRELEARLGVALDGVRIHCDADADAAAGALHARAFTYGDEIFFARGAYAPDSDEGRRLLVHELTHVVQGYEGRVPKGDRLHISRPDDALEREAEQAARTFEPPKAAPPKPARPIVRRPPAAHLLQRSPSDTLDTGLIRLVRHAEFVQRFDGRFGELFDEVEGEERRYRWLLARTPAQMERISRWYVLAGKSFLRVERALTQVANGAGWADGQVDRLQWLLGMAGGDFTVAESLLRAWDFEPLHELASRVADAAEFLTVLKQGAAAVERRLAQPRRHLAPANGADHA